MIKNSINKSKLIQLISYLDNKEFKELGLWVRSPIHNNVQIVIDLYDVIKRKCRDTDKPIDALSIMKLLKMLPRTAREKDVSPRDKQELRRAMHLLSDQIEDFLIWKATQKEPVVRKRHLMDELIRRKAYALVPAVMRKARKIHVASPLRDIQHCKNEYLLAETDLYMVSILKSRTTAPDLKLTVDALRRSCISQLLRYYAIVVNNRKVVKLEGDYPMMNILKSYVSDSEDIKHNIVNFYYTLLELMQEERVEDYYKLKITIFSKNLFDKSELRRFFGILINYCSRRINKKDNRFIQEKFELYKESLRRGVWTYHFQFPDTTFIQVIKTGLKANQQEWVNDFVEEYTHELSPDVRENTINYGGALYAFYIGKYDAAKDFLYNVNTITDTIARMQIKILSIKICYDNNELKFDNVDTHPINSELEALQQLTRPGSGTKISEDNRIYFANFVNFFKRILNRKKKIIEKEPLNIKNIETLKTELTEIQPLAEWVWLNDKLDELMKEVKS